MLLFDKETPKSFPSIYNNAVDLIEILQQNEALSIERWQNVMPYMDID